MLDELGDLGGDEARLGVLVLDLDHAHRVALAELRPEVLRLALAVERDDVVGRFENGVGRAVVLLERDRLRLGEIDLEVEDVADVRGPEAVDRLVGVADGEDVAVHACEQLQQPVLRMVRVLVLVDEHVAEGVLPALEGLGEALQHVHGQHQHVVEVDRVRPEQATLVQLVDVRDGLVVEGGDARAVLLRPDQLVLRVRDLRVDPAWDEPLRVALELLQAQLDQAHLVGLVVDGEVRAVAELRRLAAEDAAAGGVEREDPEPARGRAEEVVEPAAHLARGLVGKGDREDLGRPDPVRRDQVGDAVGEDARLARPGAGDDQQRPFGVQDGLSLRGIQVGEVLLGRQHGHASSLAPYEAGEDTAHERRDGDRERDPRRPSASGGIAGPRTTYR